MRVSLYPIGKQSSNHWQASHCHHLAPATPKLNLNSLPPLQITIIFVRFKKNVSVIYLFDNYNL